MGWNLTSNQSSDRTTGGRSLPPETGLCAKCLHIREIGQMVLETNIRSAAYNYYVCQEPCYDGPYPEPDTPQSGDDDMTPNPHLLHT